MTKFWIFMNIDNDLYFCESTRLLSIIACLLLLICDWKNSVCRQWLTGWSLALWLWIWQQRPEETLRPPGPVNCTSTTMWHTLVTPTYPADSQPSPVLSTPTTSPSYFCPWVSGIFKNTDNNLQFLLLNLLCKMKSTEYVQYIFLLQVRKIILTST